MPGVRSRAVGGRAVGSRVVGAVLLLWVGTAAAQIADAQAGSTCIELLQAQDAKAVAVCKAQRDEAEKAAPTELMARLVANDQYGLALVAVAHKPKESLEPFDREIALLPGSTVKPDSLQWAAAYWHRGSAYQQMGKLEQADSDLAAAEKALTQAVVATAGHEIMGQRMAEKLQRVQKQRADVLRQMAKQSAVEKTTQ